MHVCSARAFPLPRCPSQPVTARAPHPRARRRVFPRRPPLRPPPPPSPPRQQRRCSNRSGARIFLLTKAISALVIPPSFLPSLFLLPYLRAPLSPSLSPPSSLHSLVPPYSLTHSLARSLVIFGFSFVNEQRGNGACSERRARRWGKSAMAGAAVEVGGELGWRAGGNNAVKPGRARVRVPPRYCHVSRLKMDL